MSIENLFNVQHAIVQAPMAGACTTELVAAVSNGGGLGSFGAAAMSPENLRQKINDIRQNTDRTFNINLFARQSEAFDESATIGPGLVALMEQYNQELGVDNIPTPSQLFGPADEQLKVLIEESVPVISFHFGVEEAQVKEIHAAGLKVISSATTVEEALHLESVGVDAVIAQGSEAGGHRGTFIGDYRNALIGTLSLVPQVVDAIKVPVIAAGGIMDARGIVACRALGASAVQMGTAFLGCPESGIPELWREHLKNASASKPTVTTAMSGKPARGLRNRYITEVEALDEDLLPYPLQYSISGPIRQKALGQDNPDFHAMWSGQGVGLLKEMSASDLLDQLIRETEALTRQMANNA